MERWLNISVQQAIVGYENIKVLNAFRGVARYKDPELSKRSSLRTVESKRKLASIVKTMKQVLGIHSASKPLQGKKSL